MLDIVMAPEIAGHFQKVLAEDGGVVRIREVKFGSGCRTHMELRLGLDERGDADEDLEAVVDGVPFAVGRGIVDSYGPGFEIYAHAGRIAVRVLGAATPQYYAGEDCCHF